jgi:AraC-like DNA-binding protein
MVMPGSENILKIVDFVATHYRDPIDIDLLESVTHAVGQRVNDDFSEIFGVELSEWVWIFRTTMAAEMIASTPEIDIALVARFTGFESLALFEKCFVNLVGQTPTVFQSKAKALYALEHERSFKLNDLSSYDLERLSAVLLRKVIEKLVPCSFPLDEERPAHEQCGFSSGNLRVVSR